MTTIEEAREHIQHMDDLSERELVEMIVPFITARNSKQASEKVMEAFSKRMKAWLEERPGDELVDGEANARAYLRSRVGPESYDVTSMSPELVLRLHQAHALQVDVAVIRALSGKDILPEDVKPYRIPGNETTALIVEQIKNG